MYNLEEIEKYYEIESSGVIKSKRTNKPLKSWLTPGGYPTVSLYLDTKTVKIMVHRLIAYKHIPNPENYPVVNHKDGNKQNNNVDNLEWCTHAYNNQHAALLNNHDFGRIKIVQKDMQGNIIASFKSIKEASNVTGINYSSLAYCVRGVYKTSGGFYWERATTI